MGDRARTRQGDELGGARDRSLVVLAASWLEAERQAIAVGNANNTEDRARQASAAYHEAVTKATPRELLLALQAAEAAVLGEETGSRAWAEAREVTELLRVESRGDRS